MNEDQLPLPVPHCGWNAYLDRVENPGLVDRRMAGRGHWAHDVGHWTIGGLAPADRREHERNVLTGYLEALPADGITATNDDPARDGYRGNAVPGLFRAANADGRYPEEVNIKVVERFAAAVSDLDASQSLRRSS